MKTSKQKELESKILETKHEALRMMTVEMFVKKYPNNMDLGEAVREFVSIKKNNDHNEK
jgi:hypothetical protein